jgi:hypothetical protein
LVGGGVDEIEGRGLPPPSTGNGVVTVFACVVVVALGAVDVGGLAPSITGIGVVTVLGIVVAGSVEGDSAAFF